jgi:hypothetical protein
VTFLNWQKTTHCDKWLAEASAFPHHRLPETLTGVCCQEKLGIFMIFHSVLVHHSWDHHAVETIAHQNSTLQHLLILPQEHLPAQTNIGTVLNKKWHNQQVHVRSSRRHRAARPAAATARAQWATKDNWQEVRLQQV